MLSSRGKKGSGLFAMLALSWTVGVAEARAATQTHDPALSVSPAPTSWAASVKEALAKRASGATSLAHHIQHGMASWYGGRFAHRGTANGEQFDPSKMTAAHPSAPLGSKLLVRSEETGRQIVVTVNDRGPYKGGRVIDLSHAAAAQLGMLRKGVAHVAVSPLTEEEALEVAQAPE
ncbi:septal ring lytic transglycosylase RlpA family protein [Acetobacter sicerae]|uniref:Endolytic peptidoglycan transglycosylase RlpA n=1 Tax=Acetobacter sicerae TaxID=85325 RepID=A0ABS8VTU9_9PROT|nr:septal ring lytic transglycosylase RlpA family protein [Acetobacter sicerae]